MAPEPIYFVWGELNFTVVRWQAIADTEARNCLEQTWNDVDYWVLLLRRKAIKIVELVTV